LKPPFSFVATLLCRRKERDLLPGLFTATERRRYNKIAHFNRRSLKRAERPGVS
jgi:hypothetical protein